MTTIETIKAQILPNGHMDWGFIPKHPKLYVNLWQVLFTCEAIADALYLAGERELSEQVLRETLGYLVDQARFFNPGSGPNGAWGANGEYLEQYGTSARCCCEWQEWISHHAATLGYEQLRYGAVSIQCPASPPSYRPDVREGEPVESLLNAHRRKFVEKRLLALSKGELDFFENNRRRPQQ